MKQITIGIVAHVDAGKTTLTEQLLFQSGEVREAGSVDRGTARTDFLEVERDRGISVKASSARIVTDTLQVNIIDTPGHVDFASEVERALSVLDAGILVVSAADGIEAQTELLYEALSATHTNTLFFINKIDRAGAQIAEVLDEIREKFTPNLLCMTKASGVETKECSVNLRNLSEPDYYEEALELAAGLDDELMERYLMEEEISVSELSTILQRMIREGKICPVIYGSAFYGVGVKEVLQVLEEYVEPVRNETSDRLSGYVYRITHDKTMGRIAHVRMFGGKLQNRDMVKLASGDESKIAQIRQYNGSRFTDVGEAHRGDVVALCGLQNARVGDIIGEIADQRGFQLTVPLLKVRVLPAKAEELYPLMTALTELSAEDPKLDMEFTPEEKEIDICITGTIQLEILQVLLKTRYNLDVTFSQPTVIYKETPSGAGRGFEAYTMPKPCWAIIDLWIEPAPRGYGFSFQSTTSNDDILYRYQNHVEQELPRALKQGIYNWEVTDLKVTLTGGSHHHVHTHPLDFFLATPMALMNGLQSIGTTLLEPIQQVRIAAPEEYAGKLIGDMIAMRGEFDSPIISSGRVTMEAKVPAATFMDYSVKLAMMTSGRGTISTRFLGYEPCPLELGAVAKRRGVNPLDREKWILSQRSAMQR